MFTVGTWIYQGRSGGERNLKEAFRWQSLAADAGHPGATFNIGTSRSYDTVLILQLIGLTTKGVRVGRVDRLSR